MPLGLRAYPLHRWLSIYRTIAYQYIRPSTVATFATSIERQRANRAMPLLSAERSNGTCMYCASSLFRILMFAVEDIPEEELYRYTRNRWMHVWRSLFFELCALTLTWHRYNESVQLSERYLKFDLQQLLKAAVTAVSSESEGARYCTSLRYLLSNNLVVDLDFRH